MQKIWASDTGKYWVQTSCILCVQGGECTLLVCHLKKTLQEVLDRDYQNCLHRPKRDGNWANFQSELKSDDSCYVSKSVYQSITGDNTYSENRQFTKIPLIVRNECSFCCHLRETYVNTKHPTTFFKKNNANARFQNLKIQILWLPPFVLNI